MCLRWIECDWYLDMTDRLVQRIRSPIAGYWSYSFLEHRDERSWEQDVDNNRRNREGDNEGYRGRGSMRGARRSWRVS